MTPRGNTVIFGGGYVDGLDDVLVATSQVYGWRGDVQELESIEEKHNYFIAVAERSVLLGYEKLVAAVKIS
ncbi:gp13 protein [Mycobacteroides abscessus]|nr:gp13 protein [Mycobacteroides abscessus]